MASWTSPVTARVPYVNLGAAHRPLRAELLRAVERVIDASAFVLGAEVEAFEHAAATFVGAKHAVGVSSGTDALLVALTALGVGPGDEVLTTPFTFFATVEGILRLGATPRFVDVELETLNMDAGRAIDALSGHPRAILPVHLYGSPVRLGRLAETARAAGVPIVEDAAQSFGSSDGGRAAGTRGTLGCFSFFPTKVLGALGDGGLIVTDDAKPERALPQSPPARQ